MEKRGSNKKRSRRLMKKLRTGEFQELGFKIVFMLSPALSADEMLNRWIAEVERRGWSFGGGANDKQIAGFVTTSGRGSLDHSDRELADNWAKSTDFVSAVEIGPLLDAWYGWES